MLMLLKELTTRHEEMGSVKNPDDAVCNWIENAAAVFATSVSV
jgi:hypothetical protein